MRQHQIALAADSAALAHGPRAAQSRPRLAYPDPLRQLTIRARLFATFTFMCILLACLGAVAWWATSTQNKAFNLFVSGAVTSVRQGGDLRSAFVETRAREKEVLLAVGQADRQSAAVRDWRTQFTLVTRGLGDMHKQLRHPGARAKLEEIQAAFADYGRHMEAVVEGVETGRLATVDAARTAAAIADAEYQRAETAMQEAFALFDVVLAEVVGKINGLSDTLTMAVWIALAVAVAFATAAGWAIGRSIHRPLRRAEAFAGRLQRGDLTADVDVRGRDEVTQLCRALQEMQAGLHQIVGQARHAASTVATSSSQIAVGSVELSQRTDEQAASLEETAASLEELTSTVQQNAATAQMVRQVSVRAAEAAGRSSQAVEKVVGTMDSITGSARRIHDIVGVIDSIAFQTNILALNAAVESARAGAQGRGFAVVAGEVRSLAQRSAEAAKEIRGLIADSVQSVEAGSLLVADAAQEIDSLRATVQQVDALVAQITAASLEQGTGIAQVSDAVAHLDQVTQQNAALAEESAAAAASLKQQAAQMSGTVAMFKLE